MNANIKQDKGNDTSDNSAFELEIIQSHKHAKKVTEVHDINCLSLRASLTNKLSLLQI